MIPDFLTDLTVLFVQHIRELLKITDNNYIFSAGKSQYTSNQINLRGLVYNKIVIYSQNLMIS